MPHPADHHPDPTDQVAAGGASYHGVCLDCGVPVEPSMYGQFGYRHAGRALATYDHPAIPYPR